ncbi:MAG: DUF192 domain-containing protein, partial [Candidatus Obscuribacterales bacterium]|nr:DUF192 domain-containing protein [Candidatus Obscuribacterales bacterium]
MEPGNKLYFLNKTRNKMLAEKADLAVSFASRLVGLLKTPELKTGQGLYIAPCSQIHMFGMKYAIDVLFMD